MEDNKPKKKYNIRLRTTLSPDAFYNNFRRVTKVSGRPNKVLYTNFMTDFINQSIDEMIYNNVEIRFPLIGCFRIQERTPNILKVDGQTLVKRKVDWKATKEMWLKKHPGLTIDEIRALPEKKKVLYFENEITGNSFYRVLWRRNNTLKNRDVFKFETCSGVRLKLSKFLRDPNRKIYYYG